MQPSADRPSAVVNAVAPIRVCDNGCWTDTCFAGHGQVFNVAVRPCAEVQVAIQAAGDGPGCTPSSSAARRGA